MSKSFNFFLLLFALGFVNSGQSQVLHWLSQPESEAGAFINADIFGIPKLSANGRYVSFTSLATNLVADDTNGMNDLFVKDLQTGTIIRAYTTSTGQQITDYSVSAFSAPTSDGQWIAFSARTSQLPQGVGFVDEYLYLKNLVTGEVTNQSNYGSNDLFEVTSDDIHLSDDGQSLFFMTGNDIDPNAGFRSQIYHKDIATSTYTMLSVGFDGINGANDFILWGDVSDNGRFVVFSSDSDNLIDETLNNTGDNVYLIDRQNGTTTLVNRTPSGDSSGVNDTFLADMAVSNVGQVLFKTNQSDLVLNDTNNTDDLFLASNGSIVRINLTPTGNQLGGTAASGLAISGDGSTVLFRDNSDQLVDFPIDPIVWNLYKYDTQTATNSLLSVGIDNASANLDTFSTPALATDGSRAVFTSAATNLVNTPVSLNHDELYAINLNNNAIVHVSEALFDPMTSDEGNYFPQISSDQMTVVYGSDATNLTSQLVSPQRNLYLLDRTTNTHEIIGRKAFIISDLSPSGRYVVMASDHFQPDGLIDLGSTHLFLFDRFNQSYTQIEEGIYAEVNDNGLVVFASDKALDSNDLNGEDDVYLFNPNNQTIELVSKNGAGNAVGGIFPDIGGSGTNTWIAFSSSSDELVINDTNGFSDVFIQQWPNGSFLRASATVAGVEGNGDSADPEISANATHVVFLSNADNLTTDDYSQTNEEQLIAFDINTQMHQLATRNDAGLPVAAVNPQIYHYDISTSGRYVVYEYEDDGEFGENDFANDIDSRKDVILYDLHNQTSQFISDELNGNNSDDHSERPVVVEDLSQSPPLVGVVFQSLGGDLTGWSEHPGRFEEIILYQQGGDDVTLNIEVFGPGTVSGNSGINCSDQCTQDFALGTTLNLVAIPDGSETFLGWQVDFGDCQDDTNPCDLTMDRSKTLQAFFSDDTDLIYANGFE